MQNGGGESGALVGVGVVGGEVDGGDAGVAGLLKRDGEGVIRRCEAVVGGDDQDGAALQGVDLGEEAEVGCVGDGLAGQALWSAASEWGHALVGIGGGEA